MTSLKLEKIKLTSFSFVSFESWPGNGTYTARAQQLANIVRSIKTSNGLKSKRSIFSSKRMNCISSHGFVYGKIGGPRTVFTNVSEFVWTCIDR